MAQKITPWLLVALLLSLGFGQLLRFDLLGLPLYLHDFLVIAILALHAKDICVNPKSYFINRIFLLGLTLGWLRALTIYPLPALLIPSLYTLRLLAYLALFSLLNRKSYILNHGYFYISASVSLGIGLLQYFLLPDMRIFQYLGWDDHWNRLTLPHYDPTFTGVMLALFAFTLTASHWYIGILVYLSILLTYTRSVWLSLALTLLFSTKNKKLLLISAICLLVSIFALPRKFGEGTNLLRTYSISARLESDWAYVQRYRWDLLLGRGLNTLILDRPASTYLDHATGPNNSYLYLLSTTGVLGLMGWIVFLRALYLRSSHRPLLLFFCLASLFNNVMFYPFALLWVLLIHGNHQS